MAFSGAMVVCGAGGNKLKSGVTTRRTTTIPSAKAAPKSA
jgi:hypothetical protein